MACVRASCPRLKISGSKASRGCHDLACTPYCNRCGVRNVIKESSSVVDAARTAERARVGARRASCAGISAANLLAVDAPSAFITAAPAEPLATTAGQFASIGVHSRSNRVPTNSAAPTSEARRRIEHSRHECTRIHTNSRELFSQGPVTAAAFGATNACMPRPR